MPALRAHNLAVSLDGYLAGPRQSLDTPLGVGGERLHGWAFATPSFQRMHGLPVTADGHDEVDERFIVRGDEGIGATVMGRNMFGPVRGPWEATPEGRAWTGWWGDEPPYHHPVFVLTHHPREPITMKGGTTFHFVTDGPEAALAQAVEAAAGLDVRIGGGADTVQQCMRAGLVDELHLAIAPVLLGGGERLFDHLDGGPAGLDVAEVVPSSTVTHVRLTRTPAWP